jgi:hypothetical protein
MVVAILIASHTAEMVSVRPTTGTLIASRTAVMVSVVAEAAAVAMSDLKAALRSAAGNARHRLPSRVFRVRVASGWLLTQTSPAMN